jgi:hypothetical protein
MSYEYVKPLRHNGVTVHVSPVADTDLPPVPTRDQATRFTHAGHYQSILLDVLTGELRPHCADWRTPPVSGESTADDWATHYPGQLAGWMHPWDEIKPVRLLRWTLRTDGSQNRPYLDADGLNRIASDVLPFAQRLVDALFEVSGVGDLDWSRDAVVAARTILRICDQDPRDSDDYLSSDVLDMNEAVAAVPDMVRPDWAEMSNAELDEQSAWVTRFGWKRHESALLALLPNTGDSGRQPLIAGVRAWLYAYRFAQSDLPIVNAAEWFSDPARSVADRIDSDTTDEQMAQVVSIEKADAAARGLNLVGVRSYLRAYRSDLRAREWTELDLMGRTVKAAEAELARARAARAGQLARVIGWGDLYSRSDAELGKQAHMSRQAVEQFRHRITADDED